MSDKIWTQTTNSKRKRDMCTYNNQIQSHLNLTELFAFIWLSFTATRKKVNIKGEKATITDSPATAETFSIPAQ